MKRALLVIVAAAIIAGGVAVWVAGRNPARPAPRSPKAQLEATRLSPPPGAGDEVESEPFANVTFVYLLRNTGSQAITGLTMRQDCRCEAVEDPPREIKPGDTARVAFRLPAPNRGTGRRRVEFEWGDPPQLLLTLDVAVRVRFAPPALTSRLEAMRVTFVDGDQSPRELAFECVETLRSDPWIKGLECEPEGILRVGAPRIDIAPEVDPELVRRVYRFEVARGSAGVGRHVGSYRLPTRGESAATDGPVPLEVEVLDRVAIIPDPLVLGSDGDDDRKARLLVVRRAGDGPIEPLEWDQELIDVERLEADGSRTAVFTVAAKAASRVPSETHIVLDVGGGETRQVAVRLMPRDPALESP